MTTLDTEIRHARPRLRAVAPLVYAICWGYVGVNLLLGAGMFMFYETTVPLAVANILTYDAWGVVFIITGLLGGIGLYGNDWTFVKRILVLGLTIKSIWLIALLFRCIAAPQTVVITCIWIFFTYVQAFTYIHFPTVGDGKKRWLM